MLPLQDQEIVERYKNRWYGKYRAFVRDNHDPERLGRCRLEIPAVLGTGHENWSEWAAPCFPYGGNDDIGMFLVPEEGSAVWSEFEGGETQHPIWVGTWLAKSNPGEQPEEAKVMCDSATCQDCEDKVEHAADRRDHLEHAKWHGHPPFYCPRVKVLMKTETGHTIIADDRDGKEALRIIDRVGQIISLVGAVKPVVQPGNRRSRGTGTCEDGSGLNPVADLDGGGRIEITDASRQFMRLAGTPNREMIHLQSGDVSRSRWQKILLDTTPGRERITLFGLNGTQTVEIDGTAGREKIRLTDNTGQTLILDSSLGRQRIEAEDAAGSKIVMDGLTGIVSVKSTLKVLINM